MDTDVTIARIYLREADHGPRNGLMKEILGILQERHRVRGVTVFRGIVGFGETGEAYAADILRLMVDLPLVIEFFDAPDVVEAVLDLLAPLVPKGHIVHWQATCR